MNRATIAITSRLIPDDQGVALGQRAAYATAISDAGGFPVFLPIVGRGISPEEILSKFDGVLFTGGEDIDPKHYGETASPRLGKVAPERDEFELILARTAFTQRVPVLGICRGIQLINVAFGGSLYQDLPSELPGCLPHSTKQAGVADDKEDVPHVIQLESDAYLHHVLGTTTLDTNSAHHQAAKHVATGFRVSARAPDGVIEAIERESSDWYCIGVQSHPERLGARSVWARLFQDFIRACGEK